MNNENDSQQEKNIACEVCLKEIPISESKSAEANDYVAHFCGLDCYEKWYEQKNGEKS